MTLLHVLDSKNSGPTLEKSIDVRQCLLQMTVYLCGVFMTANTHSSIQASIWANIIINVRNKYLWFIMLYTLHATRMTYYDSTSKSQHALQCPRMKRGNEGILEVPAVST